MMYVGPAISGVLHLGLLALALAPARPEPIISPDSGPPVEVALMSLEEYEAAISDAPDVPQSATRPPLSQPPAAEADLAMNVPRPTPAPSRVDPAPGVTLTTPPEGEPPAVEPEPPAANSVGADTDAPDLALDEGALQDREVSRADLIPEDRVRIVTAPDAPKQPRGVMDAPDIDTDPDEPPEPEQFAEPTPEPPASTDVAEAEVQERNGAPPMNAPMPRPKPRGTLTADSTDEEVPASPVADAGDGEAQRNADDDQQRMVDLAREALERAALAASASSESEALSDEEQEALRIAEEDARIAAEDARLAAKREAAAALEELAEKTAAEEAAAEEARALAEAELERLRADEAEAARALAERLAAEDAASARAEAERQAAAEEARRLAEAELERLRAEQEAARELAERRAAEEARRLAEAERERLRAEEEAARELAEQRAAEEAAIARAEAEREAAEEARRLAEAELERQRAAEAEAARRAAEEQAARLAEEQRQMREEAEALRRAEAEAEARRNSFLEQQAAQRAEAERAAAYAREQQRLAEQAEAERQFALRQQQLQQFNAGSNVARQTDRNLGVGGTTAPAPAADPFMAMLGNAVGPAGANASGGSRTFSQNVTAQNNAAPLTQGEQQQLLNQLSRCWRVFGTNIDVATVRVSLTREGLVSGESPLSGSGRAVEIAVRALRECQPFQLPPQKYGSWQQLDIVFDPRRMTLQ